MINMAAGVQCKNSYYECEGGFSLFLMLVELWDMEENSAIQSKLKEDEVRKGEGEVPRSGPRAR